MTQIYMKKQYKSSISKDKKIKRNYFFGWRALKRLRSLLIYF